MSLHTSFCVVYYTYSLSMGRKKLKEEIQNLQKTEILPVGKGNHLTSQKAYKKVLKQVLEQLNMLEPYLSANYNLKESVMLVNQGIKNKDKKIAYSTLVNYLQDHPELKDMVEYFKGNIVRKAKDNIAFEIMKGDLNISKWLLERICAEYHNTTFNKNLNVGVDLNIANTISQQQKEHLDKLIKIEINNENENNNI